MTRTKKILIVDDMHESISSLLTRAGFEPHYCPGCSRDEILGKIGEYTGLIIRSKTRVDKELIDEGSNLKFVARAGSGMDNIDHEYLLQKEIIAINAPEGNRDSLGEHTLGMLLGLMHRINAAHLEVKKGIWQREQNRGIELNGKTVGLYGYGYMGSAFAEKLSGLKCHVIAYDKYKNGFSSDVVREVDLEEFMETTEILSLHIPLSAETRRLFDGPMLSRFPRLKILVNTSRGEVLKLEDAIELAEQNQLLGLAVDVLANEKPDTWSAKEKELFDRLSSLENVIITPHVGGWTFESYERINQVIVEKIRDLDI